MKKIPLFITAVLLVSSLYAQDLNKSQFLKGNIQDKEKAVKDASKTGDYELCIESVDFCLSTYSILGNDEEILELLDSSLKILQSGSSEIKNPETIAEKLTILFKTYDNTELKASVIKTIASFPSTQSISLINAYITEEMQARVQMNDTLLSAIETIKTCGNSNSFNVLFILHKEKQKD